MERVEIGIVGAVDHSYPIVEIHVGGELVYELVTGPTLSVRVLANLSRESFSAPTVEAMLETLLAIWHRALADRNSARGTRFPYDEPET